MWKAWVLLGFMALLVTPGPAATAAGTAQKVTLTARDFGYTPNRITLQAGLPAEITIINRGKVSHEFMVHPRPKASAGGRPRHEWAEDNSYFKGLKVVVEGTGVEVGQHGGNVYEIMIGTGKTAVVKFTPVKKGTFEYACLVQGHYEQGQRGILVVE